LTLGFSGGGLGASSIATSWVSGSDLIVSTCESVLDSLPGVDSGVTECGMFAVLWSVAVLFDIELMVLDT
jgi:hypothetical protein